MKWGVERRRFAIAVLRFLIAASRHRRRSCGRRGYGSRAAACNQGRGGRTPALAAAGGGPGRFWVGRVPEGELLGRLVRPGAQRRFREARALAGRASAVCRSTAAPRPAAL